MNKLLVVLFSLFLPILLIAQKKDIKGKVSDEKGNPLSGVLVSSKSAKKSVETDKDGAFTLKVSGSGEYNLVFSAAGYSTSFVSTDGKDEISIKLIAEVKGIKKTAVSNGYYSTKEPGGAVGSLNPMTIKNNTFLSAAETLEGKIAGLYIRVPEGGTMAGGASTVTVRGATSLFQSNAPLYVINGVASEDGIKYINPNDIESVDVLKDAAATGLYGIRGANGVVVIRTKRGKDGMSINYDAFVGTNNYSQRKIDVLSPYDYVLYQYERSRGDVGLQNSFQSTYGSWNQLGKYNDVATIDWQDQTFARRGFYSGNNVNVSGANTSTKYFIGAGLNSTTGIQNQSNSDRKNVTASLEHQVSAKVKVDFNVRLLNEDTYGAGMSDVGGQMDNRLRHVIQYRPFTFNGSVADTFDYALYRQTLIGDSSLGLFNPVLLDKKEYRKYQNRYLDVNAGLTYNLSAKLRFRTLLSVNRFSSDVKRVSADVTPIGFQTGNYDVIQAAQLGSIYSTDDQTVVNTNTLTFNNNAFQSSDNKHNFTALIGYEQNIAKESRFYNARYNISPDLSPEKILAQMIQGISYGSPHTYESRAVMNSYFADVNYAYNNKYFVGATFRADAITKDFNSETLNGTSPSGYVAWKAFGENAVKKNWISDLKVKFSGGQTGNRRLYDFNYLNNFLTWDSSYQLGTYNMPWQKSTMFNGGLDFNLFKRRVHVAVDVYHRITSEVTVTPSTAVKNLSELENIAELKSQGIELQLNAIVVKKKDFTWLADFNIATDKTKVNDLSTRGTFTYNSGWGATANDYLVHTDHTLGTFIGFVADGFYKTEDFNGLVYNNGKWEYSSLATGVANNTIYAPQPGSIKYKDIDGNGVIDMSDRKMIGKAIPTFFGGLNQEFAYKNFDLGLYLTFSYGGKIYNANKLAFSNGYIPNTNLIAEMAGRWTNINSSGNVITDPNELAAVNKNATIWTPTTSAANYLNSWAIEDASYLRISNLTFGYSFPKAILDRIKISKLRAYVSVNNLWVFTKYSGFDPEVSTRNAAPLSFGADYSSQPRSRNILIGLNLSL